MYLNNCNYFRRHVSFPCTWFEKFYLSVRFISWRSLGVLDSNLHCSCTFVTGYLFLKVYQQCCLSYRWFSVRCSWMALWCVRSVLLCMWSWPNSCTYRSWFSSSASDPSPFGDCLLYMYFLNCPCDAVRHILVNYPVYWNWVLMIFVLQNGVSNQDVQIVIGRV